MLKPHGALADNKNNTYEIVVIFMKIKHTLVLMLFFSFSLSAHAEACTHDADCHTKWEPENCTCGVHAICSGKTSRAEGTCQCMGKVGSCHKASEDSKRLRIRGANPMRRTPQYH